MTRIPYLGTTKPKTRDQNYR